MRIRKSTMNLEIPPYPSPTIFPLCLFSFNAEHLTTEAGNSLGVGIAQVHILMCVAVWKCIYKGEQTHNQRFRWNLLCKMRALDLKRNKEEICQGYIWSRIFDKCVH